MKNLFLVFILLLSLKALQAQESLPASGGNASGSGGTVSFTVGQVVYTTNSGTTGSIAQGVQQPYEITVINSIEQYKNIDLSFSVYPNPTNDILILKTEGDYQVLFTATLYDLNGKQLLSKDIENHETNFPMGIFVPATYFLRVTTKNQEIKSFKIIKK